MNNLRKISKKKALSDMVSYVVLIVIALSISLLVYAWLRNTISEPLRTCPSESVSLIVRDFACDEGSKSINLSLQNKGTYIIGGFYIRGENVTGGGFNNDLLVENHPELRTPLQMSSRGIFYFYDIESLPISGLRPDFQVNDLVFDYDSANNLVRLQIQPFIYDARTRQNFVCEDSVVRISVNCN